MRKILLNAVAAAISLIFIPTLSVYSQPEIEYVPVITSGLNQPIEVKTAPGDAMRRLFIVQKGGTIRIWRDSLKVQPFLNISGISVDDGERGLLSMAFHPDFESNGFFFVYYNDNAGDIVVSRYQVSAADSNTADPTGTPIFSTEKPFSNHNGGHLQFKVEGGTNYLYFATGDGGSGNDPQNHAQRQDSYLGKMIRIDVDAASPEPEIWAWGLRNPFRWSFDRQTGDVWIGDVGQGAREEINFRAAGSFGANYGWACMEGTLVNGSGPGSATCDTVFPVDVLPVMDYVNPASGSASVIGGYVYRGSSFPGMQGYYMAADFYTNQFWFIWPNGVGGWNTFTDPSFDTPGTIASFSETDDGDTIYAVSLGNNAIYRLEATPIVTPLTLVRFSGSPGNGFNDLAWTTEEETGTEKFVVEFSTNGGYTVAGELPARNNGASSTYTYRHSITHTGRILYRLKIIERDGRISYSPVIAIRGDRSSLVKIYPTIVSDRVVNIIAGEAIDQVSVIGADGRRLYSRNVNNPPGYFSFSLPVLNPGMYFLQLNGNGFQETNRIIIR